MVEREYEPTTEVERFVIFCPDLSFARLEGIRPVKGGYEISFIPTATMRTRYKIPLEDYNPVTGTITKFFEEEDVYIAVNDLNSTKILVLCDYYGNKEHNLFLKIRTKWYDLAKRYKETAENRRKALILANKLNEELSKFPSDYEERVIEKLRKARKVIPKEEEET